MSRFLTLSAVLSLTVGAAIANAGDAPDVKKLESLSKVPLVDVMECQTGDEGSLSALKSVSQMGGKKPSKKSRKAIEEFEERLTYWNFILGVASEDELYAAKADVAERQAERKAKRESMSMMDYSVYLAKRDYPCDNIFDEAK